VKGKGECQASEYKERQRRGGGRGTKGGGETGRGGGKGGREGRRDLGHVVELDPIGGRDPGLCPLVVGIGIARLYRFGAKGAVELEREGGGGGITRAGECGGRRREEEKESRQGSRPGKRYHGVRDVVGRHLSTRGEPRLEFEGGREGGGAQIEAARHVALLCFDGDLTWWGGREVGREKQSDLRARGRK